jgi:hypothetical protein
MITFVKKIFVQFILLLITINQVGAQKNFSLYQIESTPQSFYLNPGFKQNNRVYVTLPALNHNFSFMNSGFRLNDALTNSSQNDSLILNPQSALAKMKDLNYLNLELTNEIFGFGFRIKKNFISFSLSNRFQSRLTYPQDLFELAIEGNGNDLLGQRASLDGLGLNLTSYFEYAIGYNRDINDRLTVGGRIKFLSGIANITTAKSELGITTDATSFALTIDGASEINTSNITPFSDSTVVDYNPISSVFNFGNSGIGIDLGASYKYSEKLNFNASILDLGFIKWKTNVTNFVSNDVNYTFEGINLNDALDSIDIGGNLSDTLQSVFKQNENNISYTTALRTKFYLGGKYNFTNYFNAGLLIYNEIIGQKYNVGTSLSANLQLKNWLGASLSYSIYGRSYNNIGFGLSLKGGPLQFYVMTDNVLAFVNPTAARHVHASFGMNIVIGPKKDKAAKKSQVEEIKASTIETVDPIQTQPKLL